MIYLSFFSARVHRECELDYYEGGYHEEQEGERERRREQGLPPEMTVREEGMWWIREWNQARLRGERDPWMSFATFQEYNRSLLLSLALPPMTEEEMRGRCQGGPETAALHVVDWCLSVRIRRC